MNRNVTDDNHTPMSRFFFVFCFFDSKSQCLNLSNIINQYMIAYSILHYRKYV